MDGWPPTHFLRLNFKFNAIPFQFLFPSVRFIYLDTFLSGVNLLILYHRTETKGRNTKRPPKRENTNKTRPPIHRTFEYYEYCLTMISFYFGRTIPLSNFHQHYLSVPKVEVRLLHVLRENARFEWGYIV